MIDYYPYGMDIPGCSYTAEAYRYGCQGSECDRNMQGGIGYTTFFRSLDPRLGRWLNPDPKKFPWQSPYCSMDCNPVALTDVMGAETEKVANGGELPGVTVNGVDGSPHPKAKGFEPSTVDSKTLATSSNPSIGGMSSRQMFTLNLSFQLPKMSQANENEQNYVNEILDKIFLYIRSYSVSDSDGTTDQPGSITITTNNKFASGNSYTSKDNTDLWDADVFPFLNGDASVLSKEGQLAEVADFLITLTDIDNRMESQLKNSTLSTTSSKQIMESTTKSIKIDLTCEAFGGGYNVKTYAIVIVDRGDTTIHLSQEYYNQPQKVCPVDSPDIMVKLKHVLNYKK